MGSMKIRLFESPSPRKNCAEKKMSKDKQRKKREKKDKRKRSTEIRCSRFANVDSAQARKIYSVRQRIPLTKLKVIKSCLSIKISKKYCLLPVFSLTWCFFFF